MSAHTSRRKNQEQPRSERNRSWCRSASRLGLLRLPRPFSTWPGSPATPTWCVTSAAAGRKTEPSATSAQLSRSCPCAPSAARQSACQRGESASSSMPASPLAWPWWVRCATSARHGCATAASACRCMPAPASCAKMQPREA